jgi:hypothetical protein
MSFSTSRASAQTEAPKAESTLQVVRYPADASPCPECLARSEKHRQELSAATNEGTFLVHSHYFSFELRVVPTQQDHICLPAFAVEPDGPLGMKRFRLGGEEFELPPTPWRVLCAVFRARDWVVNFVDLFEEVYGADSPHSRAGREINSKQLHDHRRKIQRKIGRLGYRLSIANEHLRLKKVPQ